MTQQPRPPTVNNIIEVIAAIISGRLEVNERRLKFARAVIRKHILNNPNTVQLLQPPLPSGGDALLTWYMDRLGFYITKSPDPQKGFKASAHFQDTTIFFIHSLRHLANPDAPAAVKERISRVTAEWRGLRDSGQRQQTRVVRVTRTLSVISSVMGIPLALLRRLYRLGLKRSVFTVGLLGLVFPDYVVRTLHRSHSDMRPAEKSMWSFVGASLLGATSRLASWAAGHRDRAAAWAASMLASAISSQWHTVRLDLKLLIISVLAVQVVGLMRHRGTHGTAEGAGVTEAAIEHDAVVNDQHILDVLQAFGSANAHALLKHIANNNSSGANAAGFRAHLGHPQSPV